MKRRTMPWVCPCLLTAAIFVSCGPVVRAEEPLPGSSAWSWTHWCQPGRWGPCSCPDDYCPKPMPIVQPIKCCEPDIYGAKPAPCTPPAPPGCVDDYDTKEMPCVPNPVITPLHTCGPKEECSCTRVHSWFWWLLP